MRNLYKLTLLFIFAFFLSLSLLPNNTSASTTGTVNATSLNIRSNATLTATTVGTLKKNATVTITKTGKEWHEIKFNSKKGFVLAKYISIKNIETPAPAKVTNRSGIVTATTLNVREKPLVTAKLLGQLKKNQTVTINGTEKDWIKLTYNNKTGYILAKYVDITSITPTTGNTNTSLENNNNSSGNIHSTVNVGKNGIVTTTPLNIREDATTSSAILGTLNKGDNITITENKDGFYGFLYNNKTAYVGASYIFIGDKLPETPVSTDVIATAISSNVISVYKQADTTTVIGSIDVNTSMDIVEKLTDWYRIKFNNNYGYVQANDVITGAGETSSSTSLAGKIIMLDAGHGGSAPGALGNGLTEKEVTLDVVLRLKTKLENDGATILMTRSGDTSLSIQERAKISSASNADIFVSVHANSVTASTANGLEVYYYTSSNINQKANSSKLATTVQKHLVEETGLKSRGVKTANFVVIKYNNKPSILAEIGFLSGDQDSLVLGSDEGKDSVTNGLYLGITEYFANK